MDRNRPPPQPQAVDARPVPATAAESQRLHVVEVLKAAAAREARERTVPQDTGGDPYNTAKHKLPKNLPWQHLTRKD